MPVGLAEDSFGAVNRKLKLKKKNGIRQNSNPSRAWEEVGTRQWMCIASLSLFFLTVIIHRILLNKSSNVPTLREKGIQSPLFPMQYANGLGGREKRLVGERKGSGE